MKPLKLISMPRSELTGATRLAYSALRSLCTTAVPIERFWFNSNSECTISSLEKINGAFEEYFGNHIGKIMDIKAKIVS